MTTFLYVLRDPRTYEIRYVGISEDPEKRLKQHLHDRKPLRRNMWIRSLLAARVSPMLEVVAVFDSGERACLAEIRTIADLREQGCDLVNSTDGGEGATGFKHSEAAKQAISKKMFGRTFSPEWKAKLSAWQEGKTLPNDHKAAISAGLCEAWKTRSRVVSEETRGKIRQTLQATLAAKRAQEVSQ